MYMNFSKVLLCLFVAILSQNFRAA